MPFRIEWTATVKGDLQVPFVCRHCAARSVATVRVDGEGVDSALLGLFSGAAKQTAQKRAEEAARQQAQRLGPLGRCPACKQVDAPGRADLDRSFWVTLALYVLGAVAFAFVTGGRYVGIAVPAMALVGAFLGYRHDRWKTGDLDERVRVLPVEEGAPLFDQLRLTANAPPETGAPRGDEPSEYDWLLPLGVLGVVLLLARIFVAQRVFGLDNDGTVQWVQFGISLAAFAVIAWGIWLEWKGWPRFKQTLRDRLLVALGLCGFFGYFNFGHLHFGNFVHVWDTYHYVMGSKYFPELGYEKLYDCAAVANAENGRRDEVARQTITDLRTNIIVKTDDLLAHPEACKASFSPERWLAFKRDIAAFRSFVGEQRWREIHLDHGYNATPVWTLAGYALTNVGPVTMQQLTRLNLIDPIYLALTLVFVWWAFGPRAFAIAAIVLGCHFPNRYYWTGGAFLRHDWVFYFVASICLLKKNRPMLAGAAFAYTVLLRLFPGLAAAGVAVAAFEYFRANKKWDPRFVKYVAAGALTSVVLVGASFAKFGGVETWQHFAQNTVKHSRTPLTNHMGLRTVLSWRPDTIGQKTVRPGLIDSWAVWKSTRLEMWDQAKPLMWLTFLFGMFLVWRATQALGADPWVGAALGTGFIVIGAELTNYYYCFLMGLAVMHEKRREVGAIFAALCAVSHYLNWGPLPWMSHWLDEQYVTMSVAALFAVFGIWFFFTKQGAAIAVAEEPALPTRWPFPMPAVATASAKASKKKAKGKR